MIDESLLNLRAVEKRSPDEDGGWMVELACGHTVWFAIDPPSGHTYCGVCLSELVDQIHELKAKQRLEDG